MNLQERIQSLEKWGQIITNVSPESKANLFQSANNKNGWFTSEACAQALAGILTWFKVGNLDAWLRPYQLTASFTNKSIGLVMAGNIPLVGFHDFLCVLASGHVTRVKLSSQDDVLLPYLTDLLVKIDSRWQSQFSFEDRLNNVDAVIATGSDNSARHFEYYFRDKHKIIRKNRTSVAIVMGEENPEEFVELGQDVFTFFGLGCRNVSKVFIPEGFDVKLLLDAFKPFEGIVNHHKYANNYDYQKAIRLVSQKEFLDSGYLLLEKSEELVSPISVLYYEAYSTQKHLTKILESKSEKIQCIVSAKGWFKNSIPFGQAQMPAVNDYADGVDTMKFLSDLL
jgi:hypothetical protein